MAPTLSHSGRTPPTFSCPPDNRLVAGELERRWEEALSELRAAEEALGQQSSPQGYRSNGDPTHVVAVDATGSAAAGGTARFFRLSRTEPCRPVGEFGRSEARARPASGRHGARGNHRRRLRFRLYGLIRTARESRHHLHGRSRVWRRALTQTAKSWRSPCPGTARAG